MIKFERTGFTTYRVSKNTFHWLILFNRASEVEITNVEFFYHFNFLFNQLNIFGQIQFEK